MKTSVKNLMMSFALMGCLIIGASDASAQGRSRSQGGSSNRSQSAAVSRSSNSSAPTVSRSSSATPQVSRSSSATSRSSSSAPQVSRSSSSTPATPQVSRSSSSTPATPQVSRSSSSTTRSSSVTPQVTRSTSTTSRSTTMSPQSSSSSSTSNRGTIGRSTGSTGTTSTVTTPTTRTRTTTGATTRGTSSGSTQSKGGTIAPRDNKTLSGSSMDRTTLNNKGNAVVPDSRPDVTNDKGDKNRGGKDRSNGNVGNGRGGNKDRNGNHGDNVGKGRGGDRDRNGNHGDNRGNNRGGDRDRHGNHGDRQGNRGYSPNNHYDYSNHHYRDQFSWNYSHHSWSRPLPPPARPYHLAPLVWYRPVIPVGWHPYAGAPIIDRILGIMFGTLYEASLDHLYYNGYFIDGYADGVIFLRDVPMLNLYWPDVMLNYEYNKLVNAQFVYHSSYYDRARFDRVYRSLCRIYGSPVFQDGMTISWYGGNNTGWVTLTLDESYGGYYTTMSIGY